MKKIFVNPATDRLRSGWRMLIYVALLAVGMIVVRTILGSLPKLSTLQFSILATTTTLAVYIARRFIDKKTFASLGLVWDKYALLDVISGVNSVLVMTGVYFTMLWTADRVSWSDVVDSGYFRHSFLA